MEREAQNKVAEVPYIKCIVLDFRACRIKDPVELQLDVLDQVAGNLNVPNVCGVVLRADIVVLHQTGGIEIGNERRG
jgi:hypothetical protein